MPIRDYSCSACGHIWETLRRDQSDPDTCPVCISVDIKRMISRTNFQLKGSGWFKDGYSSRRK